MSAPAAAAPVPAQPEEDQPLVDFEEDQQEDAAPAETGDKKTVPKEVKKGSYSGVHHTGFRDFLLKAELLNAITDCGFEHPSEVQQETIPQAVLGSDIICQAKSGMGKTAVFVLATLQFCPLWRVKLIRLFSATQESLPIKSAKNTFASVNIFATLR